MKKFGLVMALFAVVGCGELESAIEDVSLCRYEADRLQESAPRDGLCVVTCAAPDSGVVVSPYPDDMYCSTASECVMTKGGEPVLIMLDPRKRSEPVTRADYFVEYVECDRPDECVWSCGNSEEDCVPC